MSEPGPTYETFLVCPICRGLQFHGRVSKSGRVRLVCDGCRAEILTIEPGVPASDTS